MKKYTILLLVFMFILSIASCERHMPEDIETTIDSVDLSQFPVNYDCMGYGEILEVHKDKLLIETGGSKAKQEYGEVVWLICDDAEYYSVGQVVTYTFRDVKAPDKEGDPLNIIALLVYME